VTTVDLQPHDDRELILLIACARASIDPARAARIRALAADPGLDWERLLELADRHGLRPLLSWHLSRFGAASVPAATLSRLRGDFQKISALSVLLTGELLRLIAAMRDRGIEAVPFKGPALAAALYGHVALRQFNDLDILVREHDVWRASEVIEAHGFAPDVHISENQRAACIRRDYVRMFRRDEGRTLVELHWGVARRSFAVPFDACTVWPRLEPMTLQGTTVPRPCAEDLLLMLCVHGSRHAWDKLEGIASLAELLRAHPALDWDRVWRTAREMRCQRMLVFALLLARGLFEAPVPACATADAPPSRAQIAMARRVVRRSAAGDEESRMRARMRLTALHLRLKDSYTDRARYCVGVAWHAGVCR
jgi:hypothetical protein